MIKVGLFIPKTFKGSVHEREGRCGPGRGILEKLIPDSILGLDIQLPCAIHDHQYAVGTTHEHKQAADRSFKYNMERFIEATGGWLKYPRLALAQVYYGAVVAFGGPAFWNGKNDPEETLEVAV